MKKIFVLTGEASGDKLASKVISELNKLNSNIEYLSVGGENLEKLGIRSIYDLKEITYLGFTNVLLNIFKMTGSYSDWGARLYELTDSPQPTSTAGIEHLKAIQLGSHGTYSRYNFVSVQFDQYGNETGISFGGLVDDSYRRNELIYIIPWNSSW